jgi:peptidoglycan/xylan/chitin deacetylase (PgdA/CDA1 family)
MRSIVAVHCVLVWSITFGPARAAECPPDALGTSRTIAVDPSEHPRVGSLQYRETLPLENHEIVLTFDDGPLPPNTVRILETLASECVKATFFMVGRMAQSYPWLVRRVYNEGHTIANHMRTLEGCC